MGQSTRGIYPDNEGAWQVDKWWGNARLRKLFDHGYVTRDFHPMAPYGTQGIYRIGPQAMTIVAQRLDMDAAYVKQLCLGTRRLEFLDQE